MHFKKIIYLLFISLSSSAQYNHCRNPNFEETYGTVNCSACPLGPHSVMMNYWNELWPWTLPLKRGVGNVGSPDHPCYDGPVGPHWGSCQGGEYFVQQLDKPVATGKMYYLSYYYHGEPITDAGIRFYLNRPKVIISTYNLVDDGPAHIDGTQYINTGIITSPVRGEWKKAYKYWVADANYSWIAVGSFNGTNNYTNVDGIRIIEVGSSECPEWNLIENTDFTDDISLTYRSSYVTAIGSSVDNNQTDGPVRIVGPCKITLKSEREVQMEPEFSVEQGGELSAYIAPCNADCYPPIADAGSNKVVCETTSGITIGSPTVYNPDFTYSWTATPTNYINNLSCTDCSNPTLLTNQNALFGTAQYALTVTNNCGQTATSVVNVIFDTDWTSNSPNVIATNINPDNYIDFDITCDAHTEWIQIEIYKNSDNSLAYSKQLIKWVDFTNTSFRWEIDQYLKVCEDYTVKIYSQNFCNPKPSIKQEFLWVRDRTIIVANLPNVFTPPNPPNAALCYNASGVDEYEIYVYDRTGVLIYSKLGDYIPTGGCLWNGTCNGTQSTCGGGIVPDGAYSVVVKFKNCVAQEQRAHFVQIFRDSQRIGNNTNDDHDSIPQFDSNTFNPAVYPNPNNGNFTIEFNDNQTINYNIEITDNLGKLLFKQVNLMDKVIKLNLQDLDKGIYYIRIFNPLQNYFNKIIIQ